jgi:ABC-2 type transport system permease protein
MTTFWYYQYNGWAQRFLSFVLIESLAGSLFPLDILPPVFAKLTLLLPTAYFIYYPMQIYLGRLPLAGIITGFAILIIWIIILYNLSQYLWHKGLKVYGAYGR